MKKNGQSLHGLHCLYRPKQIVKRNPLRPKNLLGLMECIIKRSQQNDLEREKNEFQNERGCV